jgi:hypothetical protein
VLGEVQLRKRAAIVLSQQRCALGIAGWMKSTGEVTGISEVNYFELQRLVAFHPVTSAVTAAP